MMELRAWSFEPTYARGGSLDFTPAPRLFLFGLAPERQPPGVRGRAPTSNQGKAQARDRCWLWCFGYGAGELSGARHPKQSLSSLSSRRSFDLWDRHSCRLSLRRDRHKSLVVSRRARPLDGSHFSMTAVLDSIGPCQAFHPCSRRRPSRSRSEPLTVVVGDGMPGPRPGANTAAPGLRPGCCPSTATHHDWVDAIWPPPHRAHPRAHTPILPSSRPPAESTLGVVSFASIYPYWVG